MENLPLVVHHEITDPDNIDNEEVEPSKWLKHQNWLKYRSATHKRI